MITSNSIAVAMAEAALREVVRGDCPLPMPESCVPIRGARYVPDNDEGEELNEGD